MNTSPVVAPVPPRPPTMLVTCSTCHNRVPVPAIAAPAVLAAEEPKRGDPVPNPIAALPCRFCGKRSIPSSVSAPVIYQAAPDPEPKRGTPVPSPVAA